MGDLVVVSEVTKKYMMGRTEVAALRGVNLGLVEGEFTVFAGRSGSGKTTLLNLVGGIDKVSSGDIQVAGHSLNSMQDKELTRFRRENIGFVFQSFNLIPILTVFRNVELPLLLLGAHTRAERRKRVLELIERVGLAAFAERRPSELSGGQQQRVATARAFVARPKLILADEPTANLDAATGDSIIQLIRDTARIEKTTFVVSTHDSSVMRAADRVVSMEDGAIKSDTRTARPPELVSS